MTHRNGYTILPAGKLANAVTWLEMHTPFPVRAVCARDDIALEPMRGADVARYRSIYGVLAQRWLWEGRLAMAQADLARLLDNADVTAFALCRAGRDIGLLELDFRIPNEVELAYFGLFKAAIGEGIGGWLLQQAIAMAIARNVPRFFVHTCNFDHPAALGFYRISGFVPYQTGYEIMDDPRLNGILPRDAAPHVPRIGG